jgi:hypothetical protein
LDGTGDSFEDRINQATFTNCKSKYGWMKNFQLQRLMELEEENQNFWGIQTAIIVQKDVLINHIGNT